MHHPSPEQDYGEAEVCVDMRVDMCTTDMRVGMYVDISGAESCV